MTVLTSVMLIRVFVNVYELIFFKAEACYGSWGISIFLTQSSPGGL